MHEALCHVIIHKVLPLSVLGPLAFQANLSSSQYLINELSHCIDFSTLVFSVFFLIFSKKSTNLLPRKCAFGLQVPLRNGTYIGELINTHPLGLLYRYKPSHIYTVLFLTKLQLSNKEVLDFSVLKQIRAIYNIPGEPF